MLAFGLAAAGRFDGQVFAAANPTTATFYRELRPVTSTFDVDALRVSGLDRDALARDGADPSEAMREASSWVQEQAGDDRPVFVGYPVVFDWMFLHWYFVRYADESPFGFSGCLDMKTIYQQKAGVTVDAAGRDDLPAFLRSKRPHTHNALDDAVEQAEIFARLLQWPGKP